MSAAIESIEYFDGYVIRATLEVEQRKSLISSHTCGVQCSSR
ncbi:MAG TPA: hypothetical protein VM784_09440 [Actinomycetota bacterium]|nr:hypothetical protein [Actinomycetota bacterium]